MAEGEDAVPDAALAMRLAAAATGAEPTGASRFTTGSQHYVFEVWFADRAPVVARIALPQHRWLVVGAARLSRELRPAGVPLPALLAADIEGPFPHLILERFPGTDLAHVASKLSPGQLEAIAHRVVAAQRIVAGMPTAGRYGYASEPAKAPWSRWSEVLDASIERSRGRLAATGLFDLASVAVSEAALATLRAEADEQPATPFLHDTTTKNVIIAEDGSFSGIVDVDDLCFGDPRYVVALTYAALSAFGGPVAYAQTWLRLAGFADDRLFRLYVALCYLDFMSEQGQVFNGNQAASSVELRRHLLGLFEAAVQRAGA